jgi:hypothetical protein
MNQHTKAFCNKHNITEAQYYGKEPINKDLTLDKWPNRFNPVGANIIFNSNKYNVNLPNLISINSNITFNVEGYLHLNDLTSINSNVNLVYHLKDIKSNASSLSYEQQ